MPMSAHDETDLLTVLYEGALEEPRWATFLARLRRRAGADHVSLLIRPPDAAADDVVEYTSASLPLPQARAVPLAALYRRMPSRFHAAKAGRVYGVAELIDGEDPGRGATQSVRFEAAPYAYLRLLRVAEPGGANAWLVLGRGRADFTAATGSLLSALGTHLAISLHLSRTIERQRVGTFVASAGLARFGIGWLTIDARGRVVDQDGSLGPAFARHALLQDAAEDGHAREEVAVALRRNDARPQALRLSNAPRLDILIVPLPPDARSDGAVAAVYVDAEQTPGTSTREARAEVLQTLFGLSRTEAGLADAISRGEAIAAAAMRIGITEQTARNYSKRVYAKTATTGQADLLRVVPGWPETAAQAANRISRPGRAPVSTSSRRVTTPLTIVAR